MSTNFETPVLFLIFNRPDTTFKVFEKIKALKPKYLFVAADGPRENKPGEKEKCEQARSIVNDINWDCELKTLFRNKNLGCGEAVSGGITWFFEQVEEGIILEDDCAPSLAFFQFCEKMLGYYRHDERIWHIAGYSIYKGNNSSEADYYFSQETPIWGWASWRRVWKHYHLHIKSFDELEKTNLKQYFRNNQLHSVSSLFDFKKVRTGKINTWDYQYAFYQLMNHGLSIVPNKNLVENIGFNSDATHTASKNSSHENNKACEADFAEIKHPQFMIPDVAADNYIYKKRVRLLKKLLIWPWYFLNYKFTSKR